MGEVVGVCVDDSPCGVFVVGIVISVEHLAEVFLFLTDCGYASFSVGVGDGEQALDDAVDVPGCEGDSGEVFGGFPEGGHICRDTFEDVRGFGHPVGDL